LVGARFNEDPRLKAQSWVVKNVQAGSVIESSNNCPHWSKLPEFDGHEISVSELDERVPPGRDITDLRLPHMSGRLELFRKVFPKWVQPLITEKEEYHDQGLFTAAGLEKRNPDYIAIYSIDYQVPGEAVAKYYDHLLSGKFPYTIVFDGETTSPPVWIYPHIIDHLGGRITILQRQN
jgi:hypothetical protein